MSLSPDSITWWKETLQETYCVRITTESIVDGATAEVEACITSQEMADTVLAAQDGAEWAPIPLCTLDNIDDYLTVADIDDVGAQDTPDDTGGCAGGPGGVPVWCGLLGLWARCRRRRAI